MSVGLSLKQGRGIIAPKGDDYVTKQVYTLEDGTLMLDALDALKRYKMTDYTLARTNALQAIGKVSTAREMRVLP